MVIRLLLVFLAVFSFQCASDASVRDQAKAEAEALAQANSNAATAQPASNTTNATAPNTVLPDEPLAIGQTAPTSNETVTFALGSATTAPNKKVCLPVSVMGFNNIIGMQFSIRWNPDELTYNTIENMELVDMSKQNFGDTYASKGVVALSWIKLDLKGVSLPGTAKLFDICFTPKVATGSKAEVRFEPRPTPYEIINTREEILKFSGINAVITVQ